MRSSRHCSALNVLVVMLLTASVPNAQAPQQAHSAGQFVAPIFHGWERNADATLSMVFGYYNLNAVEEPHAPVGPDNSVQPGGPDMGQPTHFYPRRQDFVFKVKVPSDWGKKELVWSLKVNGVEQKAYATLKPEFELGPSIIGEMRGRGIDALLDRIKVWERNQPPSIALIGQSHVSTSVHETLSMQVTASDDGLPGPEPPVERTRPRNAEPGQRQGAEPRINADGDLPGRGQSRGSPSPFFRFQKALAVGWSHYRGPGKVTFNPGTVLVTDGKAATQVSFDEPGEHVIRAYADDGLALTPVDLNVTVMAAPAQTQR